MPARIGPAGIWSNFDRLSGDDVVAFARSAEIAGYDTFWTQETAGRDPFTLLGHLADQGYAAGQPGADHPVHGRQVGCHQRAYLVQGHLAIPKPAKIRGEWYQQAAPGPAPKWLFGRGKNHRIRV